jgi:hypothetical protein
MTETSGQTGNDGIGGKYRKRGFVMPSPREASIDTTARLLCFPFFKVSTPHDVGIGGEIENGVTPRDSRNESLSNRPSLASTRLPDFAAFY